MASVTPSFESFSHMREVLQSFKLAISSVVIEAAAVQNVEAAASVIIRTYVRARARAHVTCLVSAR